jgi:hypothetical protein
MFGAETHQGINYLDIRNRVRSLIAKCLLVETTIPVTSIALQLD